MQEEKGSGATLPCLDNKILLESNRIKLHRESSNDETCMIDCHIHIDDIQFDPDRVDILESCQRTNLKLVCVSEDVHSAKQCLKLQQEYPNVVYPCIGYHPVKYMESEDEGVVNEMEQLLSDNLGNIVGIGEVGLDFSPWIIKGEECKEKQKQIFSSFVEIAKRFELPLNVHSRNAGKHAIRVLDSQGARNVLLHAFDGKASYAKKAANTGRYFFSISPISYRSEFSRKLLANIPVENIVLETDSPALCHIKGERNVPENIYVALTQLSEIKGIDSESLLTILTDNTHRLFPSLVSPSKFPTPHYPCKSN